MPDTKITALTALTTADPATDMFPIVDVSDTTMAASGTTKRISINNILACSPTATLATATITGDLTVDTSTLKVDSTNNRVGVGTATPGLALDVVGSARVTYQQSYNSFTSGGSNNPMLSCQIWNSVGNVVVLQNAFSDVVIGTSTSGTSTERYRIASDGVATWSNVGGVAGTAMTLNSTGLGIGSSPSYKLHIGTSQNSETTIYVDNQANNAAAASALTLSAYGGSWNLSVPRSATFVNPLIFKFGSTEMMRIDSSGNVGVGVTPSAWATSYKAFQIGQSASLSGFSSELAVFGSNCYFDTTDSRWERITSGYTSQYYQTSGTHVWRIGGTAGANTDCSFTQAMTLDASGNLLVGTTTNTPSARLYINQASGSNPGIYIAGGASTTPLINFSGAGRMRSDGQYLVMETTNASGVIYVTANTNGVYLAVGGTSWTANSDERLKDIIEPISNAVSKVGSLRSVIGKFKTDSEGTRRTFLIAQDVQKVLPEAVDASNPDRLGVGYTEVIPLLVAAIKELTARVQTLETR